MKYKTPRIDIETHENFKKKQKRMQDVYKQLTGKKKRIPLTKVMKLASRQPLLFSDPELMKVMGKKRRI